MNLSNEKLAQQGFQVVSRTNTYDLLKSPKGIIISYHDGNVEGFIKNKLEESNSINEINLKLLAGTLIIIGLGMLHFTTDITIVNGVSMNPTYRMGQIIIRSKSAKDVQKMLLNRNSIIKFISPQNQTCIKRIVAMPGDTLKFEGPMVYVNNKLVDTENATNMIQKQNRYKAQNKKWDNKESVVMKLKNNQYFVIGDNRTESEDSRDYGPIDYSNIISILQK